MLPRLPLIVSSSVSKEFSDRKVALLVKAAEMAPCLSAEKSEEGKEKGWKGGSAITDPSG